MSGRRKIVAGRLLRAALITAAVLALLLTLLWWGQRRLIYFPDTAPVPAAATVLAGARDVTLTTVDGLELSAWLVPPAGPSRELAVLVAPSNAGNRLMRAPLARALADRGFLVLLPDYRGYGGNPGRPTEEGLARDIRAARDHLITTERYPPDRIIYFGESLGAAVATGLALAHPPAGLVLRSPFTDLAAVGRHHYPFLPVRLLLRDRFPVAGPVARVTAPTVVIWGTADSIVPPGQSRAVADSAGGPVERVPVAGADHNDLVLLDGEPVIAAVVALADRIAGRPA